VNYQPLIQKWEANELASWAALLPAQIEAGLSHKRYGDLARWQSSVAALPDIPTGTTMLNADRVGASTTKTLDAEVNQQLHDALMGLHPWRKGPFELFGLHVDTEWRSDWKWNRIEPALDSLQGRRVLDVGCGSGYHCWRMRGAGASEVIGIDPTPLFVMQFWAMQKYLNEPDVWVLPVGIEHVPAKLHAFDTALSMGILYHRRSPIDHLMELRNCLRPGGQLLLETLIIEGEQGDTLVPEGRYARMGNVWFLPSCSTLLSWLRKVGFIDAEVVDVATTTTQEQRTTDWMRFHSLANFLDPDDPTKSIEGHPAPRRAVVSARVPGSVQ